MATPTLADAGVSVAPNDHEPKPTLTPPATSGESSKADEDEDTSSELSDLDMEDEDAPKPKEELGDIEPAFYYEGGRIPVFHPSMEEFRSFEEFIPRIMKHGMKSGIVKVKPPKEWHDSLPALDQAVKHIKVKNPITQEFQGTQGKHTQGNIEKQRSYNLPQWRALCDESNHQPPAKRGERRRNQETVAKATTSKSKKAPLPLPDGQKRKPGRPRVRPLRSDKVINDIEDTMEAPPTPISPKTKPARLAKSKTKQDSDDDAQSAKSTRKPKGGDEEKSINARRKYNRHETNEAIDEEAFEGFDYRFSDLNEFTAERCQELEASYWKSLNFNSPMYGADMPGSLFDESTTSWNVAHLPNLLNVLGKEVPGVNTTYLYLGMWKATFSWHLEDMDLFSINYIHFGAPKQWYSISQEDARRFEAAMKKEFPEAAKACDQFLRHKTFLISPQKLASDYHITVNRMVHYEGEFVITFPYGYHSGYNLGYNCAESVNFATEEWLQYGRIAKKCNCEADSVFVDVAEIERKLRGEPTPEYMEYDEFEEIYEDYDQMHILTPPGSNDGKGPQPKKRKRTTASNEDPVKRIKIRLKAPPAEKPCLLCPNDYKFESLIPTDSKRHKGKKVHRRCAMYMNETVVENVNGVEKALLVDHIPLARWNLKCSFCHVKGGTCFQCSDKKCAIAYHATCALPAMVQIESGKEARWLEGDDQEYYLPGHDFRCHKHRVKRSRMLSEASLGSDSSIRRMAKNLAIGEIVQFQLIGAKIYAGVVVENLKRECSLIVDILPGGPQLEIEYKYCLFLDPSDSKFEQATTKAILLPVDKLLVKPQESDIPTHGSLWMEAIDQPYDAYMWEEFEVGRSDENQGVEFLLDPKKPVQWWHYLGPSSTEAKAQYTEDLDKKRHNTKSNFLDSVAIRKPQAPIAIPLLHKSYPASYPTVPIGQPNMNALNAARAKARQLEQQRAQLRPEKPYQYRPKDMPKGSSDPRSLAQQRFFQDQVNGQMSYENGSYAPTFHQQQQSPGAYSPGQVMHQPMSPNDPRAAQQAWEEGMFGSGRPGLAPDNGVQVPFRPPKGNAAMSSSRDPYEWYQAQQGGPWMQHQQPYSNRPLLPATAQKSAPQSNYHHHQGPVPSAAPGYAQAARPALPQLQSARSSIEIVPNVRVVEDHIPECVKKYPYLHQSYMRTPRVYVSPYKDGGGFNEKWLSDRPGSPLTDSSLAEPYLLQRTHSQQQVLKETALFTPPSQRLQASEPLDDNLNPLHMMQQSMPDPDHSADQGKPNVLSPPFMNTYHPPPQLVPQPNLGNRSTSRPMSSHIVNDNQPHHGLDPGDYFAGSQPHFGDPAPFDQSTPFSTQNPIPNYPYPPPPVLQQHFSPQQYPAMPDEVQDQGSMDFNFGMPTAENVSMDGGSSNPNAPW